MAARALDAPLACALADLAGRRRSRVAIAGPGGREPDFDVDAVDALCRQVSILERPVVVRDAERQPEGILGTSVADAGLGALLAVPIPDRTGTVCVADRAPRDWGDEAISLLTDLAASAADVLGPRPAGLSDEAQRMIGVGTFEWDAASGRIAASDSLLCIWGFTPGQEPMLEDFLARVHPDDRTHVNEALRAGLRGDVYRVEFRIIVPDAGVRWLYTRGDYQRDADGFVVGCTGLSQDVTELRTTARRLEEVEFAGRVGTWEWNAETDTSRWSDQLYRMLGVERAGLAPSYQTFMQLAHPADRADLDAAIEAAVQGESLDITLRIIRPDNGEVRCVRLRAEGPRDRNGRLMRLTGTLLDVTEQRRVESLLRESEERFGATFETTNTGMALVDLDLRRFLRVNRALSLGLRRDERELLAVDPLTLIAPEDRELDNQALADLVAGRRESIQFERRFLMPDGEQRVGVVQVSVVRDAEGKPLYGLLEARDLTSQRAAERQVEHHALHHPLTGLANRTLFLDRLKHAVERRERNASMIAVFVLDVDRFRAVNERFGLTVGDDVMRALAERLAGGLRGVDTVGHLGEDTFAVACEEIADEHEALEVADRLLQLVREAIPAAGDEISLTASIGVALASGGERAEALVRDAELAAVAATERGGNRWEVFDPVLRERLINRIEVEQELRTGIERGELRLHYQPIVRADGRSLLAHEALVRWEHPTRGQLQPDDFLPVAEETGLDVALGAYVLEAACRQAQEWSEEDEAWEDVGVSVNVTARQLDQPDFVDLVARVLRETGIRPWRVRLEITETALMGSADPTGVVQALRDLGVRVILDDFGTGYSSLSHLRRFAVDELKIDRSFVADIHTDVQSAQIVDAIVSMARALSLRVVAEGVESSHQLAKVTALGCQAVQGFLIGRPAPAEGVRRDWAIARS